MNMEINDLAKEMGAVEKYSIGRLAWNRIGMATVAHSIQESGGQEFLGTLWKYEYPFIKNQCGQVMEKYGIKGESASVANLVQLALIWGFGYDWHVPNITKEHYIEAYGLWCPLVQALDEMGIQDGADAIPNWCDMFSTQIGQAVADNIFVCHAYCPMRGDRMCRTSFVELEDGPHFDEGNIYQEVVRLKKMVRSKLTPIPLEDIVEPLPPFFDSFEPEAVAKDAVMLLGRCTCHSIIAAAELMGWDRFLDILNEKHSRGYKYAAMKLRADLFVSGSGLADAASFLVFINESMGFSGREIVVKSPDRIEIVGGRCPMAEAADDCGAGSAGGAGGAGSAGGTGSAGGAGGAGGAAREASRWCDYYQNIPLKLFGEGYSCIHSHCPLRGDKECRAVLSKGD
jgi:hypothetical protein